MGDQPIELDFAVFGQLAQIRSYTPDSCPGKTLMKGMNVSFSTKLCSILPTCLDMVVHTAFMSWEEAYERVISPHTLLCLAAMIFVASGVVPNKHQMETMFIDPCLMENP